MTKQEEIDQLIEEVQHFKDALKESEYDLDKVQEELDETLEAVDRLENEIDGFSMGYYPDHDTLETAVRMSSSSFFSANKNVLDISEDEETADIQKDAIETFIRNMDDLR